MTLLLETPVPRGTYAERVQRVVSPGGITAWLLEDHTLPLLSLSFAFRGGSVLDPEGKAGTSLLLARLMTEGAGPFDNMAFARALADRAIQMGFSAGRDALFGGLRTLIEHSEHAFDLAGLALRKPHFSADAFARKSEAVAGEIRMQMSNPAYLAEQSLDARAFANHPYSRPVSGDLESLARIEGADILAQHRRMMTRGNLRVAVVGAIGAERLGDALDRMFAELPPEVAPETPAATFAGLGERITTRIDVDQTTICFGRPGFARNDPDFVAAMVVNHCFGAGMSTARLYRAARETRGLCYAIHSELWADDGGGTFQGMTSTRNDRVEEMLDVIDTEFRRMARDGIGTDELDEAKRFLIGSYGLRFDTSSAVANLLLGLQLEERDVGWIDQRNAFVAAVTPEDAARSLARLAGDGTMLITLAGNPVFPLA